MASIVHLKIKYHISFGEQVIIQDGLRGARLIREIILKEPYATALAFGKKVNKTPTLAIDAIDLDMRKDETMLSNDPESPVGTKVKTLRSVLDKNFEILQLDENPTKSAQIWANLLTLVRISCIECLKSNSDLFAISPSKIPCIDPSVACHQVNIEPSIQYVS